MILKLSMFVCVSLGLAGCSYVYSEQVNHGWVGNGSIVYALQDSIVDINLSDVGGGVNYRNISLAERTVADRNAQVAVRIQSNPVSAEQLTISVNKQSNLLTSINSTVDGKLDEVIVEAARSIGRLRGAGFLSDNGGTAEVRTIASFRVGDHVEFSAAASEFRRRTGFGITCIEGCRDVSVLPPAKEDAVIYYRIPAVLKIGICDGICQTQKFHELPTNMLTFRTIETFNSPNLVSFPIRGSAFGQVVDTITFSDGVPETVTFTGASEALDIAKVPGAVVGAVFAGITSGNGDQKSAIDAEIELSKSRKAAAEATIAEIEAFEKLNCVRNPAQCTNETPPQTEDPLPGGLGG